MGLKDLQQSFSQAWALKDPPRKGLKDFQKSFSFNRRGV